MGDRSIPGGQGSQVAAPPCPTICHAERDRKAPHTQHQQLALALTFLACDRSIARAGCHLAGQHFSANRAAQYSLTPIDCSHLTGHAFGCSHSLSLCVIAQGASHPQVRHDPAPAWGSVPWPPFLRHFVDAGCLSARGSTPTLPRAASAPALSPLRPKRTGEGRRGPYAAPLAIFLAAPTRLPAPCLRRQPMPKASLAPARIEMPNTSQPPLGPCTLSKHTVRADPGTSNARKRSAAASDKPGRRCAHHRWG